MKSKQDLTVYQNLSFINDEQIEKWQNALEDIGKKSFCQVETTGKNERF